MDDDLNTADALGAMFDFAHAANTFVTVPRGKKAVDEALKLYDALAEVLGLVMVKAEEADAEALALLEERQAARKAKDYARADEIRGKLREMGYAVEDTPAGPKLKKL